MMPLTMRARASQAQYSTSHRRQQQPLEVAGHRRRLESDHHEAAPALAGDLLPPLAAAGTIGLLDVLGDDA